MIIRDYSIKVTSDRAYAYLTPHAYIYNTFYIYITTEPQG